MFILLSLLTACTETIEQVPNEPGGNPLVADVALLPFPSDLYLQDDASTATGRRVVFPDEAMPGDFVGAQWSGADGFSRTQPILASLPGGFDPATLPADVDATLNAESSVLLVHGETNEPVAALVELDLRVDDADEQMLIIRPMAALDASAPYAVILTSALTQADGSAHVRSETVRALVDDVKTDVPAIEDQRDDFAIVHQALDALSIAPEDVILAWTFHTRSRADIVDPLLAMHRAMETAELNYTITSDTVDGDDRLVRGTFTVPWFLDEADRLVLDDAGLPVEQGTYDADFLLTVPDTVTDTRPVFVFGHGFFASLEEPRWSLLNGSLHDWQISAATTNFIGFDEETQIDTIGRMAGDWAELFAVVDQQAQSQAHHTMLARVVREGLVNDVLSGNTPLIDATELPYMGISNGGTQGGVICATSTAFDRCGLVVGGGGWSHLVQRAVQFDTLGSLLTTQVDDPRELQLAVSLSQLAFDRVDALNVVDEMPDIPTGLFVAEYDSQVNNLVTNMVARTMGATLLTPSPIDVWGLPTSDTAVSPAVMYWTDDVAPYPGGNLSPTEDNGIHEEIRRMPSYNDSMGAFLLDGTLGQACDGPCDPN